MFWEVIVDTLATAFNIQSNEMSPPRLLVASIEQQTESDCKLFS